MGDDGEVPNFFNIVCHKLRYYHTDYLPYLLLIFAKESC